MSDDPSTGDRSGPSDASDPPLPGPLETSPYPFESFEYLPGERADRARFDADTLAPSSAVVGAVAAVAGVDPTAVAPLYSVVDPDVLVGDVEDAGGAVSASFGLAGHGVTLRPGRVVVRPSATRATDE